MPLTQSIIIEFDLEHRRHQVISIDEFHPDPHAKHKIYWIHSDLNNRDEHERIAKILSLPSELLTLCEQQDGMPRLIDHDDSVIVQVQNKNLNSSSLSTLTIYLTNTFCFTASDQPLSAISTFNSSYDKALKFAKTPCFILFLILDYAINDYAQMLFQFEILSDEEINRNSYETLMQNKQRVIQLKRNTVGTREIISRLSSHKISVVSEQCRASLINLSNHNHMVVYEADSIIDMLNGYLDQLDNALMQQLSQTMKILTIFSAIFLPLTLIAGIYGMNFQWIPELSWKYGYFYALGLIAGCAILLIVIFKKLKWF